MNPYVGVLLLDPEQLKEIPNKMTVTDPGMEIPTWVIGDGKDIPDWVQCFPTVEDFIEHLKANDRIPVPEVAGLSENLPAEVRKRLDGKIQPTADALDKVDSERMEQQKELLKEWIAKEDKWKWPTKRKPRVLMYATRFSTVMKHQAKMLLKGFEKLGCETRLVTEETAYERINSASPTGHYCLPLLREINKFEPDMFLDINFYRVPALHGTKRPYYTWIQDRIRNLNEDHANAVKPNDFIGTVSSVLLQKWIECGFPQQQMILHPCNYDSDMFYPPKKKGKRKGIVYVEQNGAVTPFDAYKQFKMNYPPNSYYILDEFYGRVSNIFAMGDDLFENDYAKIFKRVQRDIAKDIGPAFVPLEQMLGVHDGLMLFMFSHDVGNRFIRQRPLVEIARAGLPLELYGQGWENHPILGPWAKGPIKDYADIPDIYRGTHIVLQLQHECTFIHRTVEALACGAWIMVKGLAQDHEPVMKHVKCAVYNRPGEAPLLASQLLNEAPPTVEESGVLNYKSEVWAKKILDTVGQRMV